MQQSEQLRGTPAGEEGLQAAVSRRDVAAREAAYWGEQEKAESQALDQTRRRIKAEGEALDAARRRIEAEANQRKYAMARAEAEAEAERLTRERIDAARQVVEQTRLREMAEEEAHNLLDIRLRSERSLAVQ
ncbi:MAG TPA: hypothetical protein VMB75_07380, partial [Rhodocyclaceae bacterium]|nr:hypothetical protein [Rhodocyclaceae bacterium]